MTDPFLIYECNLEKWRPRMYDVKREYSDPSQAEYEVATLYKFYKRKKPNDIGGHNITLELQFRVIDDEVHSDTKVLPTAAGSEIYLELYDELPDTDQIKGFLMMFEVLRGNYIPEENKVLRDGSDAKVMSFRYKKSETRRFNGYRVILEIKHNEPSSRGKLLIEKGKVIHVVLVSGKRQTTIDQFT